jgi:mannose-1-phosphate guanylyltransferase
LNLVLLSGGSGKRLWPLSNDSRSKQFLKLLEGKNNKKVSMVERVFQQLSSVGIAESTIIATSKAQVEILQSQIGFDVPLVIEPERRDTFPAIALAATYLYSVKKIGLNEIVGVLPVDPYVDDHFFEKVLELELALKTQDADLALIGVKPTIPSTKYGYIVPSLNDNNLFLKVNHFKEKPTVVQAEELINKNALWNCGVFAFELNFIISRLKEKGFPTDYNDLIKQYDKLPKISFDYEVVEKAKNIFVLPYEGYWRDLGTWNTLTEEMSSKCIGVGNMSKDSQNTHIINELDIPIKVLDISNTIVAASPDGILISSKEASPRIKELLTESTSRPMYEERRWGWFKVLDYTTSENNEVLTKRIGIKAGKNISYQQHFKRSEVWTVIKGEGLIAIDDQIKPIMPGDVIKISVKEKHGIKAITDMEIIEVQNGTELIEEDIKRIFTDWEDIERHCKGYVFN